jgi:DNA repair photolyase
MVGSMGFRWEVTDAGNGTGQLALFEEPAREIGVGEYRGLEFVHVRARRILNHIGTSARIPFSWTLNAYRGCSHACTYCFARPTHEYLGLDTADDFDRVIVVKVNAVERLRAELAPNRWAGDAIAMGTNTDPYQRAEGKYHLTRGIVEVLSAASNPFSILTKNPLVLRDLDVLSEAVHRTTVNISFSVGTLDEAVWRATEPGTPHPRKRLDAVARCNDAGVPCGVLIGPIIPGLSDAPAQIDAVVRGCVDAGARSIGHVVLHLRPGVRTHWLESLRERDPDLAAAHERLYAHGPNAPRAERARIAGLVHAGLGRQGGHAISARASAHHDVP